MSSLVPAIIAGAAAIISALIAAGNSRQLRTIHILVNSRLEDVRRRLEAMTEHRDVLQARVDLERARQSKVDGNGD